jgi:hypothetical protein
MTTSYPVLCSIPSSKSTYFGFWHQMLGGAHESVGEFLDTFRELGDVARCEPTEVKDGQSFRRGQEILRTMVVIASAGLEASLKEALRQTLDPLSSSDVRSADRLESWVSGQLFDSEGRAKDPSYLAHVLTSFSPRDSLTWAYVRSRVAGSLQSQEKLCEVVADFGFEENVAKALVKRIRDEAVRAAFECRNQVVHDYDWFRTSGGSWVEPNRLTRRFRTVEEIVSHVNTLMQTGEQILTTAVDHLEKMQGGKLERPSKKVPGKAGKRAS